LSTPFSPASRTSIT